MSVSAAFSTERKRAIITTSDSSNSVSTVGRGPHEQARAVFAAMLKVNNVSASKRICLTECVNISGLLIVCRWIVNALSSGGKLKILAVRVLIQFLCGSVKSRRLCGEAFFPPKIFTTETLRMHRDTEKTFNLGHFRISHLNRREGSRSDDITLKSFVSRRPNAAAPAVGAAGNPARRADSSA